ncbi:hypothetical protein CSB45_12875 [candidate division KSB3 bacterium]|uniref:Uncharacterized protein n=1 Tax=candidate division KSB3 bacterium TaxID=2044937 RepID=A0A2G6E2J2_9BACT|nr:MAG: hypothetical protein CSB45_12875 [candidate division KSB3 bacterium]PIE28765.1 MAG: hypothetical protein CSA57_12075 [candidate division KSB3 bacterium]
MEALTQVKHELIRVLEENDFEHLTYGEQARLRDYLQQISHTLKLAADPRRPRKTFRALSRSLN